MKERFPLPLFPEKEDVFICPFASGSFTGQSMPRVASQNNERPEKDVKASKRGKRARSAQGGMLKTRKPEWGVSVLRVLLQHGDESNREAKASRHGVDMMKTPSKTLRHQSEVTKMSYHTAPT